MVLIFFTFICRKHLFATSGPHCKCASPCPECKCSHANARSGHLFAARDWSTNHNAGAGFPANGQHTIVVPESAGGASAHAERRYAANDQFAILNQSTPYPSTYVAPPAWPMCMPSYLPQPQIQQSSAQAELEQLALQSQELEARELEVERRTRAVNQDAVKGAETKSAAPSVRSSRTHTVDSLLITRLKFCEFLILGHLRWFNFC